jgi:hypothetical protein
MGLRIPSDRTQCVRGHPWVPENISTRSSKRTGLPLMRCRACLRETARQRSQRHKAKQREERGDKSIYDPVTRRKLACKRGHPLDGDNLVERTRADGRVVRECATCRQKQQTRYRAKKLAGARMRTRIKRGVKKAAATRKARAGQGSGR